MAESVLEFVGYFTNCAFVSSLAERKTLVMAKRQIDRIGHIILGHKKSELAQIYAERDNYYDSSYRSLILFVLVCFDFKMDRIYLIVVYGILVIIFQDIIDPVVYSYSFRSKKVKYFFSLFYKLD